MSNLGAFDDAAAWACRRALRTALIGTGACLGAIEELKGVDVRGCACLLDALDRIARTYVPLRPDQFEPLS